MRVALHTLLLIYPTFFSKEKCPIFYMIIIYIIHTHTHTKAYREREEQTWGERKGVCVWVRETVSVSIFSVRKRAPYFRERALYLCKGALYFCKRASSAVGSAVGGEFHCTYSLQCVAVCCSRIVARIRCMHIHTSAHPHWHTHTLHMCIIWLYIID